MQEYTFLICVTPPEAAQHTKGGETRVEVSRGNEIISVASTIPGCGLLFRKDLVHEGRPVLEGTKEIISLNLLATKREAGAILFVVFPKDEPAESKTATGPLQVS